MSAFGVIAMPVARAQRSLGVGPVVIEVRMNAQAPVVVLAVEQDGEIYLSASALRALGLRIPAATPAFVDNGEQFHSFQALA